MKILSLIPARGGSKRLPGKNIKLLGGKPLIEWSIEISKNVPEICETLVSTDDPETQIISQKAGGLVPWLRPKELAKDNTRSVEVVIHALNWYEKLHGSVDGILLLQPTSPFRTVETVRNGINLFLKNNKIAVVSISPAKSKKNLLFKIDNGYLTPFTENIDKNSCFPKNGYYINGCFYMITPNDLRKYNDFVIPNTYGLEITSEKESIDIDTEDDWSIALSYLN